MCCFTPIPGHHYARAQRSLNQYSQQSNVNMFSPSADILSNSTEFVYEEISKMSPPSQPIGATTPPLLYSTGPQTSAICTSPYNQMLTSPQSVQSSMMGALSPQGQGGVMQALSPQSTVMQASPQNMQVMSPQGNMGSPHHNMMDASQGGMQYGSHMVTAGDLSMDPSMLNAMQAAQMQTLSQPIQVSSDLEPDFDQDMFNQLQGLQASGGYAVHQTGVKQVEMGMPQHYGSCAFQARGGSLGPGTCTLTTAYSTDQSEHSLLYNFRESLDIEIYCQL